MTVDIRRDTQRFLEISDLERAETTDEEVRDASQQMASDLIERVNEILGYDIFASQMLASGYREYAEESLRIAESNITAASEVLPEE